MSLGPVRWSTTTWAGPTAAFSSLVILAVACSGGGGRSASPSTSRASTTTTAPPVVTPDQARAAVVAFSAANHDFNAKLDIAGQDSIESGASQQADDAEFRALRAKGRTSLPGNVTYAPTAVFVPRQTAYPAMFLAYVVEHIEPTGSDFQAYLLFGKDGATAPWRLSASAFAGPTGTPAAPVAVDADGYAKLTVPDALATAAPGLAEAARAFVAAGATASVPPPGVTLTPALADQRAKDAASLNSQRQQVTTLPWALAPELTPNLALVTTDNRFLVVEVLRGTTTFAFLGQTIIPSSDDAFIRQGKYRRLVYDQIAIVFGLAGPGAPLTVAGYSVAKVNGRGE